MKPFLYLTLVVVTTLLAACKDTPDEPIVPVTPSNIYPGYTLLWREEFNGSEVDQQKWNFETGTGINGDFGTGQIDYATSRHENVWLASAIPAADSGCLAITTLRENYMGRDYTGARLTTHNKGSWGPGHRIEARIWARDILYKGQGFAFWMMPAEFPESESHITWPQGGEIDIMEYVGTIPSANLGSVHYAWNWNNNEFASWNHGHDGGYYSFEEKQVPENNPSYGGWPVAAGDANAGSGAFHIYRIDWFADRLEFSIDNNVYHINYFDDGAAFDSGNPNGQNQEAKQIIGGKRVLKTEYTNHFPEWSPFSHKFSILLTAGVGGNDNLTYGGAIVPEAIFPCSTFIDWVRVYKRQ